MREIKFRAWDKQREVMIYPDNEKYSIDIYIDGSFGVDIDELRNGRAGWWYDKSENYLLMQCTGLKDKNGKEIHEGDILKVKINSKENLIDVVKFEDGKYIIGSFVLFFVIDQSEVIGNIHENPELLETT